MKESQLRAMRNYVAKFRSQVIEILGGKCCKCGFSDVRALQIDHIEGGGCKEIRKIGAVGMYKKVIDNPSGYQLLCANCNWIKRTENNEVRRQQIDGDGRGLKEMLNEMAAEGNISITEATELQKELKASSV